MAPFDPALARRRHLMQGLWVAAAMVVLAAVRLVWRVEDEPLRVAVPSAALYVAIGVIAALVGYAMWVGSMALLRLIHIAVLPAVLLGIALLATATGYTPGFLILLVLTGLIFGFGLYRLRHASA